MKKNPAYVLLFLLIASSIILGACSTPQTQAPAATQAPTQAPPPTQPPAATEAPAATQAPAASGDEIKRGGELVFARLEEPLSLDPIVPGDNGSIFMITQIFDTLVRAGKTGLEIEPALAESWDISPDGLEYTFHLRDAKFSNGDPVTMDDILFSLERARSQDSAGAFAFEAVSKIEAVDPKTVKVTLTAPNAPFLSDMAYYVASIVPKKIFEADPKGFSSKPVGTGAFMVKEYSRGEQFVLVPNPYYWEMGADGKPLPYLDQVTVKYIPENSARILGLQNGDLDVIANVPPNDAATIETAPDLKLEAAEIFGLQYLYIDEAKAPTDNKDFRLALNYATDRETILKNVFFGYGTLPNSCLPRMQYWNKDVPAIPYDPVKAKELLASSGYKGEEIDLYVPAGDSSRKQIAVMLQQFWSEVGIKATIKEMDIGAMLDMAHNSTDWNTIVLETTSDINDDDELATLKVRPTYWGAHYSNPVVDEALKLARESTDPTVRAENYAKVQKIMYSEDGYCVPFSYTTTLAAYHDYVHNWKTIATGWWWLRDVWVSK
jgi:peptide/nickel transport system substrate-binding protein